MRLMLAMFSPMVLFFIVFFCSRTDKSTLVFGFVFVFDGDYYHHHHSSYYYTRHTGNN